jgi:hypothetical protein
MEITDVLIQLLAELGGSIEKVREIPLPRT